MKIIALCAGLALALAGVACTDSGDPGAIQISSPTAGATVASPVLVSVTTTGIVIEPAGEIKAGAGHVHVMVDVPCLNAGQSIPKDDSHVHLGDGSASTSLELAAGEHTLCVQMADGAHVALDVTAQVTFTVS